MIESNEKQFRFETICTVFSIVSNSMALFILLHSKRMKRIGTQNAYIYLFCCDSFLLFFMYMDKCALMYVEFDVIIQSILGCKLIPYVTRILVNYCYPNKCIHSSLFNYCLHISKRHLCRHCFWFTSRRSVISRSIYLCAYSCANREHSECFSSP